MVEIKVQCDCGQKYKFDVEPVNGRMPYNVNCPVCGAEGTEKANALIQQLPEFQAAEPPPAPEQTRLRLSRPATETTSAAPPPIAPLSDDSSPPPPPISPVPRPAAVQTAGTPSRQPSFGMGLLGGLLGAFVGALIYFLIFKYTGLRIKLFAIGVGALAGLGAEFLGKGEGSKELGGITAVFVVAAIVAAQYFVALGWRQELLDTPFNDSAYAVSVRQARKALAAVPTGSDKEIRNYLAKEEAEVGDKPNPNSITDKEVRQFREKDLPEFQKLASGQETEEQYDAANGISSAQEQKEKASENSTLKGVFLMLLLSKVNVISLVVAAGVAFKLSANA